MLWFCLRHLTSFTCEASSRFMSALGWLCLGNHPKKALRKPERKSSAPCPRYQDTAALSLCRPPCQGPPSVHKWVTKWLGTQLSYHLEPVGWVGLISLLVIPGREEKKSLCPGAPCPFLDLRGGGWGVNRVIALLLMCLMPLSLSTYNARGFCCPGDMNQDQTLTCQWIMLV